MHLKSKSTCVMHETYAMHEFITWYCNNFKSCIWNQNQHAWCMKSMQCTNLLLDIVINWNHALCNVRLCDWIQYQHAWCMKRMQCTNLLLDIVINWYHASNSCNIRLCDSISTCRMHKTHAMHEFIAWYRNNFKSCIWNQDQNAWCMNACNARIYCLIS